MNAQATHPVNPSTLALVDAAATAFNSATADSAAPKFASREEHDRYYAAKYWERATGSVSSPALPLAPGPVSSPASAFPARRGSNAPQAYNIELSESSASMIIALVRICGAFAFAFRWVWNIAAIFTIATVLAILLGIMSA